MVPGWTDSERLVRLETIVAQTVLTQAESAKQIDRLSGTMYSRPSWAVATIIGLLTTAVGILATYIAARGAL